MVNYLEIQICYFLFPLRHYCSPPDHNHKSTTINFHIYMPMAVLRCSTFSNNPLMQNKKAYMLPATPESRTHIRSNVINQLCPFQISHESVLGKQYRLFQFCSHICVPVTSFHFDDWIFTINHETSSLGSHKPRFHFFSKPTSPPLDSDRTMATKAHLHRRRALQIY